MSGGPKVTFTFNGLVTGIDPFKVEPEDDDDLRRFVVVDDDDGDDDDSDGVLTSSEEGLSMAASPNSGSFSYLSISFSIFPVGSLSNSVGFPTFSVGLSSITISFSSLGNNSSPSFGIFCKIAEFSDFCPSS